MKTIKHTIEIEHLPVKKVLKRQAGSAIEVVQSIRGKDYRGVHHYEPATNKDWERGVYRYSYTVIIKEVRLECESTSRSSRASGKRTSE